MHAPYQLLIIPLMTLVTVVGCGESPVPPAATPASTRQRPAAASPETDPPPAQSEPFMPRMEIEPDNFEPEAGFTPLALEDFTPFQGQQDTWQDFGGVIVTSGEPKGYLHSTQTFGNFTWRAEYRFAPVDDDARRPLANTGFMVHIQEPHKVWPRSLEVQGRWDEICSIKSNGGVPDLVIEDDAAARESARKPVGQWNAVEIVSRDGALTATLNGQRVCTSRPGDLTEGLIGLQSELFEVHFRRMRIRRDE